MTILRKFSEFVTYLIDTNVLLRFADRSHPIHPSVREAIRRLRKAGHRLCVGSQNLIEFWNVATRPLDRNGFGLTPATTDRLLRLLERLFHLLPDSPDVYSEWRRLVVVFGVSGVKVHDARIAAAMIVHGVDRILTFNTEDFARFTSANIHAESPLNV